MPTISLVFHCNFFSSVFLFLYYRLIETLSFRENGIFNDITVKLAIYLVISYT